MNYSEKVFTNELGNQIKIDVSEKEIEGVGGIFIEIEGPTSSTELHITKEEARVLYDELGVLLKK